MAKDARVTLRITDDLDQWLEAQATLKGLDKAAFARMVLFDRMNGAPQMEPFIVSAPVHVPIPRDILDLSQPEASNNSDPAPDHGSAGFDPNDLVSAALSSAEEQGLTEMPEPEVHDNGAGVRPLIKPPTPFAQGGRHQRLDAYFAGRN